MTTFADTQATNQVSAAPRPHGSRDSAGYRVKTVALSTGVTLPYVEQGDPAGTPVVMLHGITDSWQSFAPVLPHLPKSMHAFALTQRGHGDADRPARGYRTRDFAADVAAFVDALELAPAIIVGHSMGSTNALRVAIDYPQHVRALVLIDSFATYRHNAAVPEFFTSCIADLTDPIPASLAREFQESTLARPVPPEFLDLVVNESLKVPARVWRAAFAGLLEDDFVSELKKVTVPTLCLWGDRDQMSLRADQNRLLAAIPGSWLIVYEGAGHAPHWEQPARIAADLSALVDHLSK
ncbi:MAG TPA: alpha/beta hydrolase [Burkholderiaceae bacterium]|nr:alpha/beta hydrolase [Burkholderiaceae bacterium]